MNRIIKSLRHHEIQALILVAGFVALSLPVLNGSAGLMTGSVYNHVFFTWGLVIACLFLMQFAHKTEDQTTRNAEENKPEDQSHV